MFPGSSAAPTGPRSSSPARRGMSRGGIQKRRIGATRVDKDGDLVMEPIGGNEAGGRGRGQPESSRSSRGRPPGRAGHTGGISRGNLSTQQAQQAIIRGLELHQASALESHVSDSTFADRGWDGGKGSQRGLDASTIYLRIHGLKESKAASNPDGGLRDLLSFLERKANGLDAEHHRGVRIKKSYMEGDSVIITASPEDLARILKLNNFKFAGSSLTIEPHQSPVPVPSRKEEDMSQEAKKTQDRIKSILSARYDVNLKLLNLSGLGRDSALVEMGMFGAKNRISKLFPVLMVVCDRLFSSAQQKRDAIVSITLADNELDNISNVTALAHTFPDLQNLDLSRNKIPDLRALEGWRWKFRKLQNLRITENPIETSTPDYTQEILKWFPTLQILNDVQVRTPAEAAAMVEGGNRIHKTDYVSPIPPNGPDFRDVNQIGEIFVRQFFSLYDNDRATLANNFYDAQSIHSLSINISAPRSEHQPLSHPFPSAAFKQSRNLVKIKALQGAVSRIFRGVGAIKSLWAELPSTKHPDLGVHTAKYLVDCHPLPGLPDLKEQSPRGVDGLILMVHGEFEEQDASKPQPILRSFSRTFVLGPGSRRGPLIRVVSDLLVLRAWSPLTIASVGQSTAVRTTESATELRQENILKELVIRTQMTPEYASLCLTETGWDLEKAFVAFDTNKSKLPAHAFISTATTL